MANIRPPYGSPGVASFAQGDTYVSQPDLLIGDKPPLGNSADYPVPENSDLPIHSVVGVNASGDLAFAVPGETAGTVRVLGVTGAPVKTGAGVRASVRVNRSGNFNINALSWGPGFDTEAKKLAAANGQRNESQLAFGKNPYDVVA